MKSQINRILEALSCPFISQLVYTDDDIERDHLVALVSWLEDRIIRALEVEERQALKDSNDTEKWSIAFDRCAYSNIINLLFTLP